MTTRTADYFPELDIEPLTDTYDTFPPQEIPEPETRRPHRATAALAGLAAAALTLVGCSSTPHTEKPLPKPTATHTTAKPKVAGDQNINDLARPASDKTKNIVDLGAITAHIAEAEKVEPQQVIGTDQYELYGEYSTQGIFPAKDSASLFNVVLGKDGQLRYKNQSKGTVSTAEEQALINSVVDNGTLISGVMRAQKLHSIRFRLLAPPDPDFPNSHVDEFDPFFLPHDDTDHDNNNEYFFLPGNGTMDEATLDLIVEHESFHAALQQGQKSGALTGEDIKTLNAACTRLGEDALLQADAHADGLLKNLRYLRDHTSGRYTSSFNQVIFALEHGSYDKLSNNIKANEVPSCYLQDPWDAVLAVAQSKGASSGSLRNTINNSLKLGNISAKVYDDWYKLILTTTLYSNLRETAYITGAAENNPLGHPIDGKDETTASFGNIAFKDPQQVAANVAQLAPADRKAYDAVVAWDVHQLRKLYASDPSMLKWVMDHYQAYEAARGITS